MRIVLVLLLTVPAYSEVRTWTDSSGKHSVQAELVDVGADAVSLKIGEHLKSVPLIKLSETDHRYLADHKLEHVLNGTVAAVRDGHTIVVSGTTRTNVRLLGVAAPKGEQPGAQEAKKSLQTRIHQHQIRVEWKEKLRDGTLVGHVFDGKSWINKEQIATGWAKYDATSGKSDELASAEIQAREAKIGIWALTPAEVEPKTKPSKRPIVPTNNKVVPKQPEIVLTVKPAVVIHPEWATNERNRKSIDELAQGRPTDFSVQRSVTSVLGESADNAPADTTVVVLVGKPQFNRSTHDQLWSQANGQQGQFNLRAKTVEMYVSYELWCRPTENAKWERLGRNEVRTYGRATELQSQASGSMTHGGVVTMGEYRRMSWGELEQAAFEDGPFGQAWINIQSDLRNQLVGSVFGNYDGKRIIPLDVRIAGNATEVTIGMVNRLPFAVEGTINVPLHPWINGSRKGGDHHHRFAIEPGKPSAVTVSIPVTDQLLFTQLQAGQDIKAFVRIGKSEKQP